MTPREKLAEEAADSLIERFRIEMANNTLSDFIMKSLLSEALLSFPSEAQEGPISEEGIRLTRKQWNDIIKVLANTSLHGPPQGEKQDGIACAFCDMGEAGYSTRGDGFHDDACAVKDAQIILDSIAHKLDPSLKYEKPIKRHQVESLITFGQKNEDKEIERAAEQHATKICIQMRGMEEIGRVPIVDHDKKASFVEGARWMQSQAWERAEELYKKQEHRAYLDGIAKGKKEAESQLTARIHMLHTRLFGHSGGEKK